MVTKTIFLLALFGVASSKLMRDKWKCDPKQTQLTLCSNYQNILHLTETLQQKQMMLEQKIDAMEGRSANIRMDKLLFASKELAKKVFQSEQEFKDAKTQLEKHKVDITSLEGEVQGLKRRERVGKNFSEIEKKLYATEKWLKEKKDKLENLENDTVSALKDTQTVLNIYKKELSQLNTVARQLEDKVDARLDATKTELEAKLKKMQNNGLEMGSTEFALLSSVNAKVAFSATVIDSPRMFTEPPTTSNILIFTKVFTNIGDAYNNDTGIFTAPLKGVYHFYFMTFGHNRTSGTILVKNGRTGVTTCGFKGPDACDPTNNPVILELNVSDTVSIIQGRGTKIYQSGFSGFLIFPLS